MDIVEADLKGAISTLVRAVDPYAVYLFGSALRGALRQDSDVDIAFLADACPEPYVLFLLAEDMAATLHRDVDLVDLARTETVFCALIVSRGRLLINRDPPRVARFHMRALKEYVLLNEERACVLERIQARGSVYDQ